MKKMIILVLLISVAGFLAPVVLASHREEPTKQERRLSNQTGPIARAAHRTTKTWARTLAQNVQNHECPRGFWWGCKDATAPAPSCYAVGNHSWDCWGGVIQIKLGIVWRYCDIHTRVYHDYVDWKTNSCF